MDKGHKQTFAWLPAQMPTVARLMKERRAALGDAWVDECWRRGVAACEPGWFWAAEGALSVGALWPEAEAVSLWAQPYAPGRAVLLLRPKPDAAAAD